MVQSVLRAAINGIAHRQSSPCVLLTTFPNEAHGLGLLLVEALLAPEGAQCISLGPETPIPQIAAAALAYNADVVALSFSAAYSVKQAAAGLRSLREMLPKHVSIWVGGALVARLRVAADGVTAVSSLSGTITALQQWREHREIADINQRSP
jgi:MerR family transcriptional regulator, light-induced transcriptional regulator